MAKIRKHTKKRAAIERKIRAAKAEYVFERAPVCESCGRSGGMLGVSHIISVADCISDDRYPIELAWHDSNLALECHDNYKLGYCCHTITEAKKGNGLKMKLQQNNLEKKMAIYKKYMPWLYDELLKLAEQ